MELKLIKIDDNSLRGFPLFFRKIYYNELTSIDDEKKLCIYSNMLQSEIVCMQNSTRQISKTINNSLFFKANETKW